MIKLLKRRKRSVDYSEMQRYGQPIEIMDVQHSFLRFPSKCSIISFAIWSPEGESSEGLKKCHIKYRAIQKAHL